GEVAIGGGPTRWAGNGRGGFTSRGPSVTAGERVSGKGGTATCGDTGGGIAVDVGGELFTGGGPTPPGGAWAEDAFGGGEFDGGTFSGALATTATVPGTSAGAKPMLPATSLIFIQHYTVAG